MLPIVRLIKNIRLGIKTLMLHKMRSLLTMLGVVFGVGSVIAMLAVGEGSKRQALAEFERLGTNNIIINSRKPANAGRSGSSQQGSRVLAYGIKYEDQVRLNETIPAVVRAVPVRQIPQVARFGSQEIDSRVVGTTPDYFDLVKRELIAGRRLTEKDEREFSPVCVLTENLARRLLAASNTIGEPILIGDKVFTVVGIIRSENRFGEAGETPDADSDIYIPLSTCRSLFGELITDRSAGNESREIVDLHKVIVEVESTELVEETAGLVRYTMKRFHDEAGYDVVVPLELINQKRRQQEVWNWVLGSIAGISLLVGGIGIMNIMLASVTERTREIGIRRAIGARRSHIVNQFLTETLVLSIGGGFFGLILGCFALPYAISFFSGIATVVPLYAIVLSIGISVGVGVLFGLYPAIRAANLDPIVALRHE